MHPTRTQRPCIYRQHAHDVRRVDEPFQYAVTTVIYTYLLPLQNDITQLSNTQHAHDVRRVDEPSQYAVSTVISTYLFPSNTGNITQSSNTQHAHDVRRVDEPSQ